MRTFVLLATAMFLAVSLAPQASALCVKADPEVNLNGGLVRVGYNWWTGEITLEVTEPTADPGLQVHGGSC